MDSNLKEQLVRTVFRFRKMNMELPPELEIRMPLYSDYTGRIYSDSITDLLAKQICNPVLWETIVRNMIAAGADTFIELGPGRTLCGLIGKIDSTVRTFGVSDMKELDAALREVKV